MGPCSPSPRTRNDSVRGGKFNFVAFSSDQRITHNIFVYSFSRHSHALPFFCLFHRAHSCFFFSFFLFFMLPGAFCISKTTYRAHKWNRVSTSWESGKMLNGDESRAGKRYSRLSWLEVNGHKKRRRKKRRNDCGISSEATENYTIVNLLPLELDYNDTV